MCPKCVHNYGLFDLVFDYSVSLLERHLSLVSSPVFAFMCLLLIEGVHVVIPVWSMYQSVSNCVEKALAQFTEINLLCNPIAPL